MGAFHSTKIPVWNFGNSTCPGERVHFCCTNPTQATARIQKSGTVDNKFGQMERDISVRPTEITGPVKVDHLQSWSRIFRSDQTEMVRSIWFTNRNFLEFCVEWKVPHVMYDRGAWFLRVIMSISCTLCCLPSVKKQKQDFQVCFVDRARYRKNSWKQGLTKHKKVEEGGKGAVCWLRGSEKTERTWGKERVGTNFENILCGSEKERFRSL